MAKETNENEIFENPEVLAQQFSKSEEFVKNNKSLFIGGIVAIFLVAAAVMGYRYMNAQNEKKAEEAIFKAEYFFGKDSTELALSGNDDFMGLEEVATEYSGTKAGNLAKLYAGSIYLNKGESEKAAELLSDFDNEGFLVSAKAYSLAGDAYLESGQTENAVKFYRKATESMPNKEFTPRHLQKLAQAQELSGDIAGAVLTYEKFVKEYPRDRKIEDIKKYLAKAKIQASKKS